MSARNVCLSFQPIKKKNVRVKTRSRLEKVDEIRLSLFSRGGGL